MHRRLVAVLGVLGLVTLGSACAHGDADDPASPTGSTQQRSEACLKFQKSFCNWDVTMCATDSMTTCEDTASSLFCTSDDKANACTAAIPTATCASLPTACTGVIDPGPAIAACNTLLDDYCAASERCGQGKKADCIATSASSMNCAQAIGASPAIDQCYSDLGSISCDTLAQSLPTSCTGVIKVSSTATPPGAMLRPRPVFFDAVSLPAVDAH
jgi:hypothetical protein